jgi:hypothetical protein
MAKPATFDGYSDQYTVDCERVLVTLLRGLGPWKESVYLIGGLTPRYLVAERPPVVPAHAGTLEPIPRRITRLRTTSGRWGSSGPRTAPV